MTKKTTRYERRMGFFDLLMSPILDRQGTMDHLLLERPSPPYLISSLVSLLVVLVLPTIVFMYRSGVAPVNKEAAWGITLSLAATFVVFTLSTTVLLRIMGIHSPLIKVIAANIYSMVSMIPLMLAYYIANVAVEGELTIVTFFAHGEPSPTDWLIEMFPLLVYFACLLMFLMFINAIRAIGNTPMSTAIMLSLLCIPLLIGSYTVGATLASQVFPGATANQVWAFLPSLVNVPQITH